MTQSIDEAKLAGLTNTHGRGSKLSDLEKAAHSQGIDLGDKKREGHHITYPDAKFRKSGESVRSRAGSDVGATTTGGTDKQSDSFGASMIRKAVLDSGRVDKRPEAKAKRKDEAEANKKAKSKYRNPFTRKEEIEVLGDLMGILLD